MLSSLKTEVKARELEMLNLVKFLLGLALITSVKCNQDNFDKLFGSKSKGDSRIVGGETSPEHYPYQISLQMASRGGGGFFFFQQPASNW